MSLVAAECFVTNLFNIGHAMELQFSWNFPEGFEYQPAIIGVSEEEALVARIRELPTVGKPTPFV